MERSIGAYEARRKLGQLIEEVWERNEEAPAAELEKDVEEAIKTLREERRSRNKYAGNAGYRD